MAAHVSVVSTIARSDFYQPARALPINVSPPTLSGTPRVGSAVTCSTGSWLNFPTNYSYQWYKDAAIVSGATTNTYTPTIGEGTHSLFCRVTPTNAFGTASSVDTAAAVIDIETAPLRTFKVSATDSAATYTTIAQVNAASFLPGDAILFKGGETFSGGPIIVPSSGDSSHRITFGSYGGGKATITSTGDGVQGVDKTYVDVRDLVITGPGITASKTVSTGTGVRFEHTALSVAAGGPRILNCEISAFPWNGILIHGTRGSGGAGNGFDGTQIKYNTVANCCGGAITGTGADKGATGIAFWGRYPISSLGASHTNVVVEHNTVTGCTGVSGNNGAANTGAGIGLAQCSTATVQYNHAGSNGALGTGSVGISCFDSSGVVFRFNTVYNHQNASGGLDGMGLGLDHACTNCTVEFNYATGCYGSGFYVYAYDDNTTDLLSGCVVRYNIAERNCSNGTAFNHGEFRFHTDDPRGISCDFHNNVAFTDRASRFCFTNFNTQNTIGKVANNIFAIGSAAAAGYVWQGDQGGLAGAGTSATFVNNCYSGEVAGSSPIVWNGATYVNVAQWLATATTQERISSVIKAQTEVARITGGALAGQVTEWVTSAFARYQIATGSPLADIGLDVTAAPVSLSSNGTTDFFQNAIPVGSGYAIGAHDRSAISTASEALIATTYTVSGTYDSYTGASASGGAGLRDSTDNAANSVWADDSGSGVFITADCGASKTLTKIITRPILSTFDSSSWPNRVLSGCPVWTSVDGSTWSFAGYSGLAADGVELTLPLGSVAGRYVKITKSAWVSASLGLATFKVYGF